MLLARDSAAIRITRVLQERSSCSTGWLHVHVIICQRRGRSCHRCRRRPEATKRIILATASCHWQNAHQSRPVAIVLEDWFMMLKQRDRQPYVRRGRRGTVVHPHVLSFFVRGDEHDGTYPRTLPNPHAIAGLESSNAISSRPARDLRREVVG